MSKGYSNKNPQTVCIHEAIHIWEIGWKYGLVVRNNSSHTAYNTELQFPKGAFTYLSKLDRLQPILAHSKIELEARFTFSAEGNAAEADVLSEPAFPVKLQDLQIIILYTNEEREFYQTNFYLESGIQRNEIC